MAYSSMSTETKHFGRLRKPIILFEERKTIAGETKIKGRKQKQKKEKQNKRKKGK